MCRITGKTAHGAPGQAVRAPHAARTRRRSQRLHAPQLSRVIARGRGRDACSSGLLFCRVRARVRVQQRGNLLALPSAPPSSSRPPRRPRILRLLGRCPPQGRAGGPGPGPPQVRGISGTGSGQRLMPARSWRTAGQRVRAEGGSEAGDRGGGATRSPPGARKKRKGAAFGNTRRPCWGRDALSSRDSGSPQKAQGRRIRQYATPAKGARTPHSAIRDAHCRTRRPARRAPPSAHAGLVRRSPALAVLSVIRHVAELQVRRSGGEEAATAGPCESSAARGQGRAGKVAHAPDRSRRPASGACSTHDACWCEARAGRGAPRSRIAGGVGVREVDVRVERPRRFQRDEQREHRRRVYSGCFLFFVLVRCWFFFRRGLRRVGVAVCTWRCAATLGRASCCSSSRC